VWGHAGGLIAGFIATEIFTIQGLSDVNQAQICLTFFVVLCLASAVCSMFVKEDLRRLMFSKLNNATRVNISEEISSEPI